MRQFFANAKLVKEKFITFFKAQSSIKKILIVGFLVVALIGSGLLTLFLLVWSEALGPLPGKEEISLVENPSATEVYSADSVLLGRYFIHERSNIRYEDIPEHVENTVLATEDIRFYKHHGIDTKSLMRVLFKSILMQKESSGGGSTITQQLAKNLYPRQHYKFLSLPINKIREMIIAWRFESTYDKKSILTLYLNTIPFADNTYGIEAASQRFFSVPTRELSLDQAAVLVGMLKATHYYNPRLFADRAKQRRNVVLSQLAKYNMADPGEVASLQKKPLKLAYKRVTHHTGLAPYFRAFLRQQLLEWCRTHTKKDGKPFNLYTDGLRVYTTIDSRLQHHAEEAVNSQMAVLQKKFINHWGKQDPWHKQPQVLKEAIRRSDRYRELEEKDLSEEEIDKVMNTEVTMNIFTWEGEKEVKMSPVDSIRHYLKFLNAGLMIMDPSQGAIRAWVGGINHHYFQYDHVKLTTKRQVGSTFKPIVYAAALERGINPCDFISSEKTVYTNIEDMDEWAPQNNDSNYDLKYSMEGALAYSVNTVSVKILEQAGIRNTVSLAQKMGISSEIPAVPSLALGVADISMTEMVSAYSCFVNGGKSVEPFYITAIANNKGRVLQEFKTHVSEEPVLSEESAQMMIHMLRRTVNEGTGGRLRWEYGINNDIGGKTGTTQSNADGWFIAVTPKMVIGAWVGADDPRIRFRSTSLGQGSSTALPVVAKFFQKANKDKALREFTQAKFPRLQSSLERQLACDLYKSDVNFWESIFGKPDHVKEVRREFGDEKPKQKGLFKKLFGKNK